MFPGSSSDTTRQLSVLVGADVTLGCLFDKLSRLVEWSALTVEWNVVDTHAEKSVVYTFEDGRAHVNREGSEVDRMQLRQSDASLQLHNVTVGDEGLYSCRIITPVVYTETTSLEVLGIYSDLCHARSHNMFCSLKHRHRAPSKCLRVLAAVFVAC